MGSAKGATGSRLIEVMDTTLRDGEQTHGVSFTPREKLSIAKSLLEGVGVDRIEVGNARVSRGEAQSVSKIAKWARAHGHGGQVEVLGFVDGRKSVDWVRDSGVRVVNILAKGSEKHCRVQLRKAPEEHTEDILKMAEYAEKKKISANVYLEDWANGMLNSKQYVKGLVSALSGSGIKRVMLPDTLGMLSPAEVSGLVSEMVSSFQGVSFDFHAHNDYGLATANALAAAKAGASAVHVTVNGLGERAGNAALDEVVVALRDKGGFRTAVREKKLLQLSRLVERFSGKRIAENKPIAGENVFTQTAGIHADGDRKGNLYASPLFPQRFGRESTYALGKFSGRASLEMNLKRLGLELTAEQRAALLERIVRLGDKKEKVTMEDLPFIAADLLETPQKKYISIDNCIVLSGKNLIPTASLTITFKGKTFRENASGIGGYDAFMNAVRKVAQKTGLKIPELVDYEVRIPPGGRTDAIVEATISWSGNGNRFRTIGVDSDQLMAAVKATEKMLNLLVMRG